jgi:hypothetical protein
MNSGPPKLIAGRLTDPIAIDTARPRGSGRRRLTAQSWAETIHLSAFGVSIGLRSTQAGALDSLVGNLPLQRRPGLAGVQRMYSLIVAESGDHDRGHCLYANARLVVESPDLVYVLDRLESHLQIHLGQTAPERIFVHAGVVGWRERAIVIPGRSYSGKSTLVAALLRAGATYCSDEFAVVDTSGRVHPYPRPLSLRQPAGRPLRCAPEALGARAAEQPLLPGLVLIARYQPGGHWRGQPITPGQALLELMKHTLPVRQRTEAALNALQPVIAHALVLKGTRGEAEDMAQDVLRLI